MSNSIIYLITCYRGLKDQATGLFSFIDIFDTLFIPKGSDFLWQTFYVGGRVYVDSDGPINLEVFFEYPDGKGTPSAQSVVSGTVQKGEVHFAALIPMTKFTLRGKYRLIIKLNGQELTGKNDFYFNVTNQI